jgi:hypothetical protein
VGGGVVVVERGPIVVGFGKKSGMEVRSSKGTRGFVLEGEMEAGEAKMERGGRMNGTYKGVQYIVEGGLRRHSMVDGGVREWGAETKWNPSGAVSRLRLAR